MVPKKIVGELVLQLLELADAAGFFCYHLAEHHVTPLGTAPSPALPHRCGSTHASPGEGERLQLRDLCVCMEYLAPPLRSLRLFASEVMPAFSSSAALAT